MTDLMPGGDLRQGDICEISFFPHWHSGTSSHLMMNGKITQIQLGPHKPLAASQSGKSLVVVCSYDCDIENPRGRKGLLLAPLIPIPQRHPRYAELKQSNAPHRDEDGYLSFQFVNHYAFSLGDVLPPPTDMGIAEFSAITSWGPPNDVIAELAAARVHRLSDDEREVFRTKLAVFVGRPHIAA